MRRPFSGSRSSLKLPVTQIRRPSRRRSGTVKLPAVFGHQPPERIPDQLAPVRVFLLVRPPRLHQRIRQLLRAEPGDIGKARVDLDDEAVLVDHVEGLVQRVEQGVTPAGVVVALPRQLHRGPHPGQQLGRGERLDQVVVGPGLQPFDGRLLPGAGRKQQHRHLGRPQVGPQRRDQRQAAQPGIITSLIRMSGGSARAASSASCPSVTVVTS